MPSKVISKKEYDNLQKLQDSGASMPPSLAADVMGDTCTLAALGAGYQLGNLELSPATLETFGILNAIDSPFLNENISESDITIDAVAAAVFIFHCAPDTLRPVMALAQRREALKQTENIAANAPGFYEVYLSRLDQLATIQAAFNADALRVYSSAGQVSLEEAVTVIMNILRDAMDGFSMLPGEEAKKKNLQSLI
jgi:hypothetical protein